MLCVAARKIAYARQVIPMLPFELAWYGYREGMPEPLDRRGYTLPQRRVPVASTFQSHDDDDKADFDFSADVPSRRRRRRGSSLTSTPPDSPIRSPEQSKPGSPRSKDARKIDRLDRRSSSPRQQLRPRPSQRWDPREFDEEIMRDIARHQEKERAEAAVGFLVPTSRGGKHKPTKDSRVSEWSDAETSSDPDTEAEQSQGIARAPTLKAPIANMGTFQPSSTSQKQGKRVKMYAHKTVSNSLRMTSATQGPAVTRASRPDHNHGPSSHTPAAQTDLVLTRSERSAPRKTGRTQISSKAAKKSAPPQGRKDVSSLETGSESPKESSGEEMVFLPGFADLIEPSEDDDEDDEYDEDKEIYGHSDGKLRTTAARSSRQRRRRATSSSSASQSPPKKRSKKPSDEVIRAALRPANQPPPKLQFSPGQVKKLGLEGVAKLEKGKVDASFDKNAPGYSEHGRYSRYINRTDWSGPQARKTAYPEHMTSGDFYYPEEVPKMKQPTPPLPPLPAPRRPRQLQQQRARAPQAPRYQHQQTRMQRGSMAPTPPRRQPQHQQRGASVAHQQRREQFQVRDDEVMIISDDEPPRATPGPRTPSPRARPGWISGEWMELAQERADDDDPLDKFFKKKD